MLTVGPKKAKVTVGDAVKVSLQTKDWIEAKERFRITEADLQVIWDGLRNGPVELTPKQVFALAGRFYRMFAETLEENPGSTAQLTCALSEAGGGHKDAFGCSSPTRDPTKPCTSDLPIPTCSYTIATNGQTSETKYK